MRLHLVWLLFVEHTTIRAWHDDVGQEQVDVPQVAFEKLDGFRRNPGLKNSIVRIHAPESDS